MPRRLPVPPPPGAPPPDDPDHPDVDDTPRSDDALLDEEALFDDELDDDLVDPDAWPDDEEPSLPAEALDEPLDLVDDLSDLGKAVDDAPLDDDPLDDDAPLIEPEDELDDLVAESAVESLPIVGVDTVVRLVAEGRDIPAIVDTTAPTSVWEVPDAEPTELELELELAGHRVSVTLARRPADAEQIRLGRDVLADRFLVRP